MAITAEAKTGSAAWLIGDSSSCYEERVPKWPHHVRAVFCAIHKDITHCCPRGRRPQVAGGREHRRKGAGAAEELWPCSQVQPMQTGLTPRHPLLTGDPDMD